MSDKKLVNYRLGQRDIDLIGSLSEYHGCTKTSIIRRLIRNEANNIRDNGADTIASKRIELCILRDELEILEAQLRGMEIALRHDNRG